MIESAEMQALVYRSAAMSSTARYIVVQVLNTPLTWRGNLRSRI